MPEPDRAIKRKRTDLESRMLEVQKKVATQATKDAIKDSAARDARITNLNLAEASRVDLSTKGYKYVCDNIVPNSGQGVNSRKVCDEGFTTLTELDHHLCNIKHIGIQTTLEKCHMWKARSPPVFICDLCRDEIQYTRSKYQIHLKVQHNYVFACTVSDCTVSAASKTAIQRHLTRQHRMRTTDTTCFMWYAMVLETPKPRHKPDINRDHQVLDTPKPE